MKASGSCAKRQLRFIEKNVTIRRAETRFAGRSNLQAGLPDRGDKPCRIKSIAPDKHRARRRIPQRPPKAGGTRSAPHRLHTQGEADRRPTEPTNGSVGRASGSIVAEAAALMLVHEHPAQGTHAGTDERAATGVAAQ